MSSRVRPQAAPIRHRRQESLDRLQSLRLNRVIAFASGAGARDIGTMSDGPTPSVDGYKQLLTGGTTTITNFINGELGQEITVIAEHAVTITDGTNIHMADSADLDLAVGDVVKFIQKADGLWYETGRATAAGTGSGGGGPDLLLMGG